MLGCTIINNRQHVGLQKLSVLAGITNSSLGPNKKYKFIQDDATGESTLVCSCFRILENLEVTCAVGQLVNETVKAHQKVYHTGAGCLLFLAGAWSRAGLECLQNGISVTHIISAMSEGIDVCLDVCRKFTIPIEDLCFKQPESTMTFHSGGLQLSQKLVEASQAACRLQRRTQDGQNILTASGQRTVKLSRHFCGAKSANVSIPPQPSFTDIAPIAEGLSHGHVNAMNLAVEASRLQSRNNLQGTKCLTFDVSKVLTCVLPGLSEEHACVLPGCIVLLSAEQASVAHHLKEQHLKVALINGDLSDTYRHIGLNRPRVHYVSDRTDLSGSSKEEAWMETVVTLLLNLEVNLILISGLVSEKVIQRFCRLRVLVVEKVKAPALKAFAKATGAVPVAYATQLTKHCIGVGVKVEIWKDLGSYDGEPSTSVNISTGENSELVTVILTSCLNGKLQALEDQFWTCAYRLHHALKDRVLLPGAGVTEMLCINHLQRQAGQHIKQQRERNWDCAQQSKAETATNPYRGLVLHLMAGGLIDYISTVMVNTGRFSKVRARTVVSQKLKDYNESLGIAGNFSQICLEEEQENSTSCQPIDRKRIYDNLSVKQEVWRKALDLVFLVLQTDAELITGIDQQTEGAQENLMLL